MTALPARTGPPTVARAQRIDAGDRRAASMP
jgi:hypothetical protein